jgi:hypothetical protein
MSVMIHRILVEFMKCEGLITKGICVGTSEVPIVIFGTNRALLNLTQNGHHDPSILVL